MSGVIFSSINSNNNALFGKFDIPIKALITEESNAWEKQKTVLSELFNVERSYRFAENIMSEGGFDLFQSAEEGAGAENDNIAKGYDKTIYHIEFKKNFTITRKAAADCIIGKVLTMNSEVKKAPRAFISSYYRTRTKLASWALANGTSTSGVFNKATVDLSTGDGLALFSNAHTYKNPAKSKLTQSNYYYSGTMCATTAELEASLNALTGKMRNFKDENGESLDYVADTLLIPSNRSGLEAIAKKVVGTERTTGTDYNDINIQYGKWTLVVLPGWETSDDRFMIMSSTANRDLMANMFYNREPLDIASEVDINSRNYIWNGYCRMGIGFSTWKHILLAVDSATAVSGATELT